MNEGVCQQCRMRKKMTIHVFATIMALYTVSSAQKIAEEFGLSAYQVRKMARICRVKKEKSFLREICSRNAKIAAKRQRNLRSRRISRAIRLYNQGHTLEEIARILKVSVATVYKYKKFLEDKKQTK